MVYENFLFLVTLFVQWGTDQTSLTARTVFLAWTFAAESANIYDVLQLSCYTCHNWNKHDLWQTRTNSSLVVPSQNYSNFLQTFSWWLRHSWGSESMQLLVMVEVCRSWRCWKKCQIIMSLIWDDYMIISLNFHFLISCRFWEKEWRIPGKHYDVSTSGIKSFLKNLAATVFKFVNLNLTKNWNLVGRQLKFYCSS